ncbi:hypothetical protein SAY87_021178 [Trapa incisa]|uniref:Uncharacterized protein n=1 Tax=Trapa incisa TaxID=236973 RepID=A0AAN7JSQ9_9MYRT|nr:hypothetical protein SAY87_021178 [Trapa incisa]
MHFDFCIKELLWKKRLKRLSTTLLGRASSSTAFIAVVTIQQPVRPWRLKPSTRGGKRKPASAGEVSPADTAPPRKFASEIQNRLRRQLLFLRPATNFEGIFS